MYTKKSYCYKQVGGQRIQRVFAGHISVATAKKYGYDSVALSIYDGSGKGRGETREFYGPNFYGLKKFN